MRMKCSGRSTSVVRPYVRSCIFILAMITIVILIFIAMIVIVVLMFIAMIVIVILMFMYFQSRLQRFDNMKKLKFNQMQVKQNRFF